MKRERRGRSEKTALLTAFEPFGGRTLNASELAARPLDGRVVLGHRIVVEVLPCRFDASAAALRRAFERVQPRVVVACGEAAGRAEIAVERVAINVDDAALADNAGAQPVDRRIAARGPVGYWSTLPIKAIVRALTARGIPAVVSQSAGTFVCNHLFYELMRFLARRPSVRGGFVHVPRAPAQQSGDAPTMPVEAITAALEVVLATALRSR